MLSDEVLDKVIARLTRRIEQGNEYILEQIGKSIKKIGKLTPSKAYQLGQLLQYGGDYEKIVKKLAEITKLNVNDIKKIFDEVAKENYMFSKQFYDYRGKKFIPYEENLKLKTQVEALANMTAHEYVNMSQTLAFSKLVDNKVVYTDIARAYQEAIDKAVLSVAQGKTSFDEEMYRTIKELGASGIKTVDYQKRKGVRLDSAVRMHMRGALRTLHNEEQKILGEQFEADGVEISVHLNPAPDHEEVQGKQFSTNKYDVNGNLIEKGEFEKFQSDERAVSYDGVVFEPEYEGHDRRSISEYNCYHYVFAIVLGVSQPQYTNEQLRGIINNNNNGFELDGKHYTNYQGTQLQRQLEAEIRKQKDEQIIAKAAGNEKLVGETQKNITVLTNKYRGLSAASGLPTQMERMRVSNYRRVAVDKIVTNKTLEEWDEYFGNKYGSYDFLEGHVEYRKGQKNWVELGKDLKNISPELLNESMKQVEYIYDKYNLRDKSLNIKTLKEGVGFVNARGESEINFIPSKIGTIDNFKQKLIDSTGNGWHIKVKEGNILKYPITHELGHIIENRIVNNYLSKTFKKEDLLNADLSIKNEIIGNVMQRTNLTEMEVIDKYLSGYAKSQKHNEWFAESFAQLELGEKTIWIEEFEKWLKKYY